MRKLKLLEAIVSRKVFVYKGYASKYEKMTREEVVKLVRMEWKGAITDRPYLLS